MMNGLSPIRNDRRKYGLEFFMETDRHPHPHTHRRHLHIQIILKEKVNKKKRFLDEITQTHCNYQVTHNDRAWNEYIRKGGDYIEFGQYQSISARGQKQWLSSAIVASTATTTTTTTTPMITTIIARAQAKETRQLAKQAMQLDETSVNSVLDFI